MTRSRDVADTQDNVGGAVPPFATGKNKIINGDFGIWQRGTSFSASGYTADRWNLVLANTATVSQQTFTPGTAPVPGYESTFFARFNRTARPTAFDDYFIHRIEDVRTFAGQTVVLSFWAKSSASTTLSGAYLEHWFGSGGSSSPAYIDSTGPLTLTTSWQRFTKRIAIPSIAGKTIGTNSFLSVTFAMANSVGLTGVYDIWGVQLEAGSVATPFQTASGSIGGELALCQRYYETGTGYQSGRNGAGVGDNHPWVALTGTSFQVAKRAASTITLGTPTASLCYTNSGNTFNITVAGFAQIILYLTAGSVANMSITQPWTASAEL